jgi:hypothetical protein
MYAINRTAIWIQKDPNLSPDLIVQDVEAWTLLPSLPSRLRLPDGLTRTGLNELDGKQLAELGFYPAKEDRPALDPATQVYGEPKLYLDGETVIAVYPVIEKTKEQILAELAGAKEAKLAELAEARWNEEVGGLAVNGVTVLTDDRSKALLTGAVDKARNDPKFTTTWKSSGGIWVTLDAKTIIAIGEAVSAHVQSCFSKECALASKVLVCSTIEEVNSIKWENS